MKNEIKLTKNNIHGDILSVSSSKSPKKNLHGASPITDLQDFNCNRENSYKN